MISTVLTQSWGLRYPLVQAPMAGAAGGRLAGAVSAAGALGMIGISGTTPTDWIAEQAALARPHGPLGFGLMVWALERRPELLDAVLAERPFAVSLTFGDPAPYVGRVQAAGALVELPRRLRASKHEHTEYGDLVAAEPECLVEELPVLRGTAPGPARETRPAATSETLERLMDLSLVVLDDRVAVRRLVAREPQRVERERVGVGDRHLLLDEAGEDACFFTAESHRTILADVRPTRSQTADSPPSTTSTVPLT